MFKFIDLEILVANALLFLEKYKNEDLVTLETLVNYSKKVTEIHKEKTKEDLFFLISEGYQEELIKYNSNYFELIKDPTTNKRSFKVKDYNNNQEDLEIHFQYTLDKQLLESFENPESLKELGIKL